MDMQVEHFMDNTRGPDHHAGGPGGWACRLSTDEEVEESNRMMAEQQARHDAEMALNPPEPMTRARRAKWMCSYFQWQIENILKLERGNPPEGELATNIIKDALLAYRKQLLFSVLDTVAMQRYLTEGEFLLGGEHQRRWIQFLTHDCGWKDGTRVSLQVLMMRFLHRSFAKSIEIPFDHVRREGVRNRLAKEIAHPTSWRLAQRSPGGPRPIPRRSRRRDRRHDGRPVC